MLPYVWKVARPILVNAKRQILFQRPIGLKRLGRNSFLKSPRAIRGRKYVQIGENTQVHSNSVIMAVADYSGHQYRPSIDIGSGVYIGRHVYITAIQDVTISDGCVLSEHVYITDLNHGFAPPAGPIMAQKLESKGPVKIGANCFLGYRVAVMPGVTLGDWCIVGANSVVTQSFPAYSMVAGAPARVIKIYSHELAKWIAPDAPEKLAERD